MIIINVEKTYVFGYNGKNWSIKMDDKISITLENDNGKLQEVHEKKKKRVEKSAEQNSEIKEPIEPIKPISKKPVKDGKRWLVFLILGSIGFTSGLVCLLVTLFGFNKEVAQLSYPEIPSKKTAEETYSLLTGEPLADVAEQKAPVYCIQTPNGTDGARPQAGLNQAGVIFEAIAEAGITRFAAIYQKPTSAIIGPIRSLRLYYLEWDTPFDCTIVHAGGAADALSAVSSGRYKDLSENYTYMYRGTYRQRLWNNLFTTADYLQRFSSDHGYNESDVKGFTRMTPEESNEARINDLAVEKLDITKPTNKNTSELTAKVGEINVKFGGIPNFNANYVYNPENNTYSRSYQSGAKHEVYQCKAENLGEKNPEDVCELTQMAPSVVIAMVVSERRASDNYHEVITTTGSGKAYVFQNGNVVEGTWNKPTKVDQIKFLDQDGKEIKLAPGQTFVSAIPNYGSIEY